MRERHLPVSNCAARLRTPQNAGAGVIHGNGPVSICIARIASHRRSIRRRYNDVDVGNVDDTPAPNVTNRTSRQILQGNTQRVEIFEWLQLHGFPRVGEKLAKIAGRISAIEDFGQRHKAVSIEIKPSYNIGDEVRLRQKSHYLPFSL